MSEAAELRECPFCAGEARLNGIWDVGQTQYKIRIECSDCGCRTKEVRIRYIDADAMEGKIRKAVEDLSEIWNGRHRKQRQR